MKTKIRRYICKSVATALALMIISLHTPEAAALSNPDTVDAVVSYEMVKPNLYKASLPNTKDIKAYRRYINKYLSSNKKYPSHKAVVCDINVDGIYEMFFSYNSGVRSAYKIYTYKKGKIIKMGDFSGCNFITYNTNKKQICVIGSAGADHSIQTCYKMIFSKLKKIAEYESISITNYSDRINKAKYYKNGKRIPAKKYKTFSRRVFEWPVI